MLKKKVLVLESFCFLFFVFFFPDFHHSEHLKNTIKSFLPSTHCLLSSGESSLLEKYFSRNPTANDWTLWRSNALLTSVFSHDAMGHFSLDQNGGLTID